MCKDIAYKLSQIVYDESIKNKCDCLLFSGGIDTSFILMSLISNGMKPKTISVLFKETEDKYYIDYAKNKLNIENYKVIVEDLNSVSQCLKDVLIALKTIDPIEVISGLSVCLGLKKAKELGCKCILTGDGGDELYFGYDFLFGKSENYLNNWLKNVLNNAFFNSIPISKLLEMKVFLPLYSNESKEIAINTPVGCKINKINDRLYGKYLMRMYLYEKGLEEIALRNKTPITSGSGSEILLDYWKNHVSIDEIEKYKKYKISFPSRAHLYLFKKGLELNLFNNELENKSNINPCPICGHEMKGNFCKFCGAYINPDNGNISVYRD